MGLVMEHNSTLHVPNLLGPGSQSRVLVNGLLELAGREDELPWEPFVPGVERVWLYADGEYGPAAGLIRFSPGAHVPEHLHLGFEHILVLRGSQSDEHGSVLAGDLLIHRPGSTHRVASAEGCLVLAIYEKRVKLLEG
jgi:anti-sigma factor ChrR (cupin superfamily)